MTDAQIIVLATPVFFALIGLEYWVGVRRGRNTYRLNDAISSIALGMLSQVVGVLTKLFTLGIYTWVFERAALIRLDARDGWVWVLGLLLYDFLYYWHHRLGHTTALLWAAHAVHHQSEDYNLSTALRQTGSGWLVGWIFYLPMAILGFPPLVYAVVALIDLLYQFWVHTQQIGKLGWFDRWFCSPSNHRVHHAVNDPYLDRNYGGILVIWDRMFGSFQEELDREPCVYGTRDALRSWNPWTANLQGLHAADRQGPAHAALAGQAAAVVGAGTLGAGRGRPHGARLRPAQPAAVRPGRRAIARPGGCRGLRAAAWRGRAVPLACPSTGPVGAARRPGGAARGAGLDGPFPDTARDHGTPLTGNCCNFASAVMSACNALLYSAHLAVKPLSQTG